MKYENKASNMYRREQPRHTLSHKRIFIMTMFIARGANNYYILYY